MNKKFLVTIFSILFLAAIVKVSIAASKLNKIAGPVAATVVSVHDGDTFIADAHPWLGMTIRTAVRLFGIDTPELMGKCDSEKQKAQEARKTLTELIGKDVILTNIIFDKYAGRVVAEVYNSKSDTKSISQILIEKGLGRSYDGGHKQGWC